MFTSHTSVSSCTLFHVYKSSSAFLCVTVRVQSLGPPTLRQKNGVAACVCMCTLSRCIFSCNTFAIFQPESAAGISAYQEAEAPRVLCSAPCVLGWRELSPPNFACGHEECDLSLLVLVISTNHPLLVWKNFDLIIMRDTSA